MSDEKTEKPLGVRWERTVIEETLLANVREQRKTRFWSNLFRIFLVVYLLIFLFSYLANSKLAASEESDEHTAVVELIGLISADSEANAEDVNENLREAFEAEDAKGVVMRINSPGGSPVQSGMIFDEIHRLREKYPDKPFYVVIEDIGASGGYYIAAAGQEIYADRASIVGSIGVIIDAFGFVDAMKELGVERRVMTAGEHKAMLDPFSPKDDIARAHLNETIAKIHQQFIDAVKKGRGERLGDDPKLFSGLVWDGETALAKGLIDGLGSVDYVARELIEAEELVVYTSERDVLDRLADRLGTQMSAGMAAGMRNELGELVSNPRLR